MIAPKLTVLSLASMALVACDDRNHNDALIAEGSPVSGMVWEFPPSSRPASNSGHQIDKESLVSVYPTLIVIVDKDGTKQIVPLSQVTDLKLK